MGVEGDTPPLVGYPKTSCCSILDVRGSCGKFPGIVSEGTVGGMPSRVAVDRDKLEPGVSVPEGVARPLNQAVPGVCVPLECECEENGMFPMLMLRGIVVGCVWWVWSGFWASEFGW